MFAVSACAATSSSVSPRLEPAKPFGALASPASSPTVVPSATNHGTASPAAPSAPPTPAATRAPIWHATGRMISPRAFHTATRLPDGKVLVAGGLVNDRLDGKALSTAESYDPANGTWTAAKPMTKARWGHTAILLSDGRVLVAGGYRPGSDSLSSAELFDPRNGRWTATGNMTKGRGGHTATLLTDGTVLVVGGGAEDASLEGGPRSASAEVYDPRTGRWTAIAGMIEARKGFTATMLSDGTVLVAGGDGGFTAAELYHPRSRRWTATGSMADGRYGHTATLLPDGTVLVSGGCACSEPGAWASAELYQPSSRAWMATGSMRTPRIFHTATLLPDGMVLVVNDGLADGPASAELYSPTGRTWAATASPAATRFGDTATLLVDGKVLVTGDYDYQSRASAELYDPGGSS
jgi:hypothetical protein